MSCALTCIINSEVHLPDPPVSIKHLLGEDNQSNNEDDLSTQFHDHQVANQEDNVASLVGCLDHTLEREVYQPN